MSESNRFTKKEPPNYVELCLNIKPASSTKRYSVLHRCGQPKGHFGYCQCENDNCDAVWNGRDFA